MKLKVYMTSLFCLLLVGCHQSADKANKKPAVKTAVAQMKPVNTTLYFTGTVQPLSVHNVVSPADGVVTAMHFNYGGVVKRHIPIVKINSEKLEEDYNSKLATYLKSKDDLNISNKKLNSTRMLWKLKIIPHDELSEAQSAYNNARIGYLQSLYDLKQTFKQAGKRLTKKVTGLTIADAKDVGVAMRQHISKVTLKASVDGVALVPPQSDNDEGGDNSKIVVGSQVKAGQVLVAIGDLSGLSVSVKIPEIDIDKVKPKQAVTITSVAFPDVVLKGTVKSVDSQAGNMGGSFSGLPTFPAKIIVPKLNADQQNKIRVGMSVKIRLDLPGKKQLMLPIDAVKTVDGKTMVTQLKNGKAVQVAVSTGQTTINGVVIKSGLHVGDKVRYSVAGA
jgi:HlyD family secretion protein